jgi:hypothetical protein
MSSINHAVADAVSPLENADILLRVLNILGPGQRLFISAVSKAWKDNYERVESMRVPVLWYCCAREVLVMTTPRTTLFSAVLASPAALRLADEHGLTFDNVKLQRIAGRTADIPTLQAARELGLALTDKVLEAAAQSGSLLKLQWLHIEQTCQLPPLICNSAARSGSIDMLKWLKELGNAFTTGTFAGAAAGGHTHVLQF